MKLAKYGFGKLQGRTVIGNTVFYVKYQLVAFIILALPRFNLCYMYLSRLKYSQFVIKMSQRLCFIKQFFFNRKTFF